MAIMLDHLVSRLVDTLIGLANEGLHSILGVSEDIEELRGTLCSIQDVVDDAQQRSITERGVKQWLSRLTDVMYDADDILDEYRITAEEWASQENPQEKPFLGSRTRPFFTNLRHVKFNLKIGDKISDLNKRLKRISDDRSNFALKVDSSVRGKQKAVARVRRETTPGVEPDIVGEGIEKNTRHLVNLLKKEEKVNSNVGVLAIVGLGGIGKTTLAQKIFNDGEMKSAFQKTMWVCVSQEFEQTNLLREIITSAKSSPGEAQSKAQLESMVKDVLKDSKFLLVLDDVWNVQIWEDLLRKPLQVGAVGSRVLVTTRDRRVAERMKAIHIHNVDALPLDDSWLLLCRKVTKDADEEIDVQSLKDIGMKIVEKCGGLPLAITVLGGVLCGKFSRWEWERVERSSTWSRTGLPDGVHQALYLSYEDLPSNLKQCFLYYSLFREDSILDKETLAQLWVAEGFVVEVEGEEYPSLEEIAQGYYEELVQRSLLQRHSFEGFYNNFIYYYTMHDLLRSLCHSLARDESSVITDTYKQLPGTRDDESIKLRRLSITSYSEDIKSFLHSTTQRHKSVRTLLLQQIDDKSIDNCFKNFQRLRVVHLLGTKIHSLPKSIGNLLHLRYLNLAFCEQVMALPESIARLKNLQILILIHCNIQTFPKGLVQLHNLRTLDLGKFNKKELPSGMARLQHLNVLRGAVVSSISSDSNSSSSSCSLEEISKLRKLRELSIRMVEKTMDESEQKINSSKGLMALENLVALKLLCSRQVNSEQQVESEKIEKIFDVALHPPSCVRQIKICSFFGHQFPRWLMTNSISLLLPNLTKLVLRDCHSCSLLPPLGKLPQLESLDLHSLFLVTSIGAEFFGYEEASTNVGHESGGSKSASSSQVLFPRLKQLSLKFLDNLEEWQWVPEDGRTVAMPRLNKLNVHWCPKLLSLPEGLNRQAKHLTKLCIICPSLNSINGFPFVKKLILWCDRGPKIVSYFPALEVLKVRLNAEQNHSIRDWLVQSLPYFTSLQELNLDCNGTYLLRSCLQDGPDWRARIISKEDHLIMSVNQGPLGSFYRS